jgi:hypothetical protein
MSMHIVRRTHLMRAKPEGVRRLAIYLKLDIEGMSDRHVARYVWWALRKLRREDVVPRGTRTYLVPIRANARGEIENTS